MRATDRGYRDLPAHVLVVAKAPVAGLAKTRLAATFGDVAAAQLAAAALLDTLTAVASVTVPGRRLIALTGDLHQSERAHEIIGRLAGWRLIGQRGSTFAERLVRAHRDAATWYGPDASLVQIGMDTPQVTGADLVMLAAAAESSDETGRCAVGPAVDGGWWGLATSRPGYVDGLADVEMSRDDTCAETALALRDAGADVTLVHRLRDVDTGDDAVAVAQEFPALRFSALLSELIGRQVSECEAEGLAR